MTPAIYVRRAVLFAKTTTKLSVTRNPICGLINKNYV